MKPSKADITPQQSCSCTSCLYRSESDRTSVRKIIARGSKIDKLYYGKYIPLRERKLLDKLVRTRAVYDDIRHQLLSGSSISVSQADLKPRKNTHGMEQNKDTQRDGDIPTLVDLVDKGNVLSSENSSECCSCCICGSKLNIHDDSSKIHMHKHKRRAGAQMNSKSSVMSRDRTEEETMFGRAVHFKTKHIRSDPCTCTYKFNDKMKRRSKSVLKKLRKDKPKPVLDPLAGVPELTTQKKQKVIKKSIEKVKQSKAGLVKGIQEGTRKSLININETKMKVQENIAAVAKKSLELIQETKQKIHDKMESSKYKPEYITQKSEEPTEEKFFKIRKDSLIKFREKLRKRRDLKNWECDFECDQAECVPEECFKILKRRRLTKIIDTDVHSVVQKEITSENKSDGMAEISKNQAHQNKKPTEVSKRKQTTRKTKTEKTQKLDRSCVCIEIKKKNTKHTKSKRPTPGKNSSRMKSKTSLLREPSEGSPGAISIKPTYKKKESKISNLSESGVKIENFKVPTQMDEEKKEAQISQKARQAVRVGSSFSFNIEFYKETPIVGTSEMKTTQGVRSIIPEQEKTKSKGEHNFVKKMHKRDRGSETTLSQSVKNIQAIGHPLKRCFCTFKLKPRKTKIALHPNKSTNKKCICPCTSPVIVQTEIKRHSVSVHTKKHMKSSSSITSHSNSSVMSRGLQVQPVRKPIIHPQSETAPTMYTGPVVENPSSRKQAVRIGSTFSFQIEFSKSGSHFDSPVVHNGISNKANYVKTEQIAIETPKTAKGLPVAKHYIRHKISQISSSTKTKFSRQKHKLRRCFCTLKMNKALKKQNITAKGTITSGQSIENAPEPKPAVISKTVSMATKKIRYKFTVEPHECEPGICTPGSCDPYECLELIKRRESKEMRNKANTANKEYRKMQSTSSFPPKSITRSRTKKVQSILVAYKGKVPNSKSLEKKLPPRQLLETPKNLNKQVVKIGSNFSFNVEFYKDKPVKDAPVKKLHPRFIRLVKQQKQPVLLRERGSQIANVTRNSVLMQAASKQKNVPTSKKRCFCTLKLRKSAKEAKKDVITVGTKTPKFKNKQPKFSELEPYECEPYVCSPNLCNPYECLQRIEKRNGRLKSREIGIIAKPFKMKSTSSSGQNVHFAIKNAYAQSKTVEQKVLIKKSKQEKPSEDQKPQIQKVYAGKPRQSVKLGSNFSFNIEFYKDRKSDENQIVQVPREREDIKREDFKLLKNQGQQPTTTIMSQHESQVNVIKKIHKATGVAPILKRCFCTLQLQKKRKHPIKPTQVYTVSRVSITKPAFVHKQLASKKVDSVMTSCNKIHQYSTGYTSRIVTIEDAEISSCDVLSCSTVQFESQLLSQDRCHDKHAHLKTGSITSQPTFILKSDYLRNDNNHLTAPKATRSLYIRNPTPTRIRKFSDLSFIKYYEPYTSNIKQHPNEVNAYLRRQFCAMNIQVDKYRSSPIKQKLKPYECEPGVCTPDECDPLVCQERIIRRLMKKTAKSSGTPNQIHSVSSTTFNARRRSKRLQSNASNPPLQIKQSPSILEQKTGYPRSEQQAVRVGSNFSLNIEFSKKKLQPPHVGYDPTRYPSTNKHYDATGKKLRHRGTREYLRKRMDRESQSNAKMEHKGSNAMPLLKRCFCTLKLHKKDGKVKRIQSLDDKEVSVNDDRVTVQTVNSTQNTEPLKNGKLRRNLEPYECEPGICVPGQCDPYECLELINKRKINGRDFGTNVTKLGKMSTASMTSKQKSKMKNRCNQLRCKNKELRVQQYKHSGQRLSHSQPSRQAVHIGSAFSFNVEFFKENPNMETTPSVPSKSKIYKTDTEIKRPRRTHDFKERFNQDNRIMTNKDSQSGSMQQKKSTMTSSFIKRCFCTAKLQKNEKINYHSQDKTIKVNVKQQSLDSPSFLQRCMCIMKSLTAPKFRTGIPSQTEQKSASKPSDGPASHRLEPYECTPGVCVPDECDPYECEQLIRKRNAKVCTKETCTRRLRTRSQSSTIKTYQSPKFKKTQITVDRRSKIVKPTPSGKFERRKSIVRSGSPGRQAVRIGSNFNFNIDFYKDRPTTETIKDKSLVDYHRKKVRTSDYSESYKPKTKSRGSFEKKKHRHSRDSQAQGIKKQDRATGVSRLLQRCFCTLNLGKTHDQKRYSESGTQSMRTAVIKESPNIDTKIVMTDNKLNPNKLEAYECEPNTCIPGQCDPYDCEKRIKKRLRREYGTSTVQFKTKSATSMTLSARKLRNMKIQSRLKKSRRNRTDLERAGKSSYKKTVLPGRSARQAVRLASTFSFNVEFYKENNNDPSVRHTPKSKIRHENVDDFDYSHKKRSSISCNTKTCQAKTRMREVDSQVLAKKMRSTMSGVTPFLKRCFCTLKLQKPITHAQYKNDNNITRPKMETDNKSTYTSKKLNKSRNFARTQHLDPYECEPGVCVPGECDPYECEKLIKKRDRRGHSVSSNTEKGHGTSKYVSARAGHKGRKSHATSVPYERQKKKFSSSDKPRALVHQSDFKTAYSPHRQAVRIGSNFSFDIEFYKDKNANDSPKETSPQKILTESKKINRFIESSKSKTQNMGAGNRGIGFYHRKSQAYGPNTEAKGSGVGPLLKRCFCTLKLHKQGKQQYQSTVPLQADYTLPPSYFDASTETKKQRRILEPYECEPNVCVPGFCDPYDCLRRIKHRQMREFGVATKSPSMRSDYSLTSRRTTRDQSLKTKHVKDKRPQRNMSFDRESNNKTKRHSLVNENLNRQAVRIGSSFKFDIEFYKQRSTPNNQAYGDSKTYDISATREGKQKPKKIKSHGSQGKCSPHCQGVQMEGAQQQSRGSGMAPLLKRCFCTLALQKNLKQPVPEKQTTLVEVKMKDMCNQSKYTFNKSKSLPYALDPYECQPNVCVPGECDPYDCYERIKKRNAPYKSKGLGTNARRYSQASSMTTGGMISQSKRTQSISLDKHRRHHRSSSVNKSIIVEQPRLQLLADIANKNVVKVGSNISFNIEFYKEVTPAATKINYTNKRRGSGATIYTKQKNTHKTTHYHNRDSQAQTLKTQNKGSLVSNTLKRCFCTAQLHKPNISPPKIDINKKCVECRPKTFFRPQEFQVYYHKTSLSKNPKEKCLCTTCDDKMCQNTKATSTKSNRLIKLKRRSTMKSKKNQNANDMETILPYTPNKFNKKASKTLFFNFNNKGIADRGNKYCAKLQCPNLKKGIIFKNRRLKIAQSTKKLNANKIKKPQPEGQDAITSTSSNLNNKSFLCRCKELFSKKKFTIKNNATDTCAEVCPLCKSDRTKKELELKPPKNLKKTKSERRPTTTSKNEPKKSKSLKIKNNLDLTETRQDYSQFQSGDMGKSKKKRTNSDKNKSKMLSDQYKTEHLRCGDDYLYLYVTDLNQKLIKDNKKQVKFSEPNKDIISANLTPKSVRKGKLASKQKVGKGVSELEPMKANCQADTESYLDIVLQPSYCSGTQMEGIAAVSFKGDNKFKTKTQTKRKSSIKEHRIQDEDFESEDKRAQAPSIYTTPPHTPSIYRKKTIHMINESKAVKPGASLKIAAKGSKKQSTPGGKCDIEQIIETLTKNINAIKNAKSRVLNTMITKEQICSCYSSVCECAKAIRKEKERAQKIEMELENEKRMLQEREKMRKAAEKEAKKKHKEFLLRQKRYEQEDTMRRRKRSKENKLLGHRLKHVKTSDVLLAADSILDIAKLGCTVVGDVARSTCRFVTDPVYTCKKMKNAAKDPGSMIKRAVDDSGLVATLKRVFMRVTAMKGIKTVKSSLEENQFTGYLMKMAEDDPRKRMKLKKKKQAKKKAPALDDFECSLYMASLRRKRFLSVYYLCPWFYPHFITLLNVVEQVTDLILFLLAVFVWSPCILCMELCRACMCCFFCTG